MNMVGVFPLSLMVVVALSAVNVGGAFIEIPDDLVYGPPSIESHVRAKRGEFSFGGQGSRNAGHFRAGGGGTFFDSGRTKLSGSGFSRVDFARHSKPAVSSGVSGTVNHQIWQGRRPGDSLDLSATANKNWYHGTGYNPTTGSVRLDAHKDLYTSGTTNIHGNAFHNVDLARGSKPIHTSGAGLEVTKDLGHNVQLYGGANAQKNWNTRHSTELGAQVGVRKSF